MRSSSGAHFIALDHIRALAAFMVFTWHFIHGTPGNFPVPSGYAPAIFPLAVLDLGHTGVALFMCLSGYLFAKLLDRKSITYSAFLWNRVLRLLPLIAFVVVIVGVRTWINGEDLSAYVASVAKGIVFPTLPNGGWSITTEFHFYLILPLLLWMLGKSKWIPFSVVLAAIALRAVIYDVQNTVQIPAYLTIVGRVDQFVLGMLMFHFRHAIARRHAAVLAVLLGFTVFYWFLDFPGGLYPAPEPLWIVLPTIEGVAWAIGIAWYDASFSHPTGAVSRFIGRIGEYSYSIYLLHAFFVFQAAAFIDARIVKLGNFYVACVCSLVCFLLMIPLAHLSYRFIEAPFLKLRKPYVVREKTAAEKLPDYRPAMNTEN